VAGKEPGIKSQEKRRSEGGGRKAEKENQEAGNEDGAMSQDKFKGVEFDPFKKQQALF